MGLVGFGLISLKQNFIFFLLIFMKTELSQSKSKSKSKSKVKSQQDLE